MGWPNGYVRIASSIDQRIVEERLGAVQADKRITTGAPPVTPVDQRTSHVAQEAQPVIEWPHEVTLNRGGSR